MAHILLVSYDLAQLNTRQFLLEQSGHTVTSAAGFAEALQQCSAGSFDLLAIGNSVPLIDKQALLTKIRRRCTTPVLVLLGRGGSDVRGADRCVDGNKPDLLLAAVQELLAKHA